MWLNRDGNYGYKVLVAESSLEAGLFIASVILDISEPTRHEFKDIKNKVVIVNSVEAWNKIVSCNIYGNDILYIPTFSFTEDIRCPNNISAILPMSKYSLGTKSLNNIDKIEIPMRTRANFNRALESLGYNPSEVDEIAMRTKRRFSVFYRIITNIPTKKQPKWTTLNNFHELIPALLLGGWSDKYAGDKEIVEKISGVTYDEYTKILAKWMSIEDSPLFYMLGTYQTVSIHDSWSFLFDKITSTDIDMLDGCVKTVFSVVDPSLDLPEDQRFMASIYGKTHIYSASLQRGIIISLIMLAERDSETNSFGIPSPELL